jgi:hypothetical protein
MSQARSEIERKTGIKEMVIGVRQDVPFKELVTELESVFKFVGCGGCLSGLERFTFESSVLTRVR